MVINRARMILPVVLLVATLSVIACGTEEWPRVKPELPPELESDTLVNYTEVREPCDCRSEYRNLYFGDLHAHTTLSYDAYIWKTSTTPAQAYKFAKGGQLALTPLDSNGSDTRYVRLSRPLDFLALTDHQEFLAEYYLCTDKGSAAYDCTICQKYREGGTAANLLDFASILLNTSPAHSEELCNTPGVNCTQAAQELWHTIVENAEKAYDRSSACTFTAFPAYEYTRNTNLSDRNRNVIFRNSQVPVLPPSFMEQWTEQGLWEELNETCLNAENGCDCITIPHASNWANGNKFTRLDYGENSSLEEQREAAALRARMEPLVEIHQHKGDMECKSGFEGVPYDPQCDFEDIWGADFVDCGDTPGTGGGVAGLGCLSRYDYIRNVLKLGLSEWVRTGVNPYKLGIIGGTDTHNGIPGKVEEYDYPGHMGTNDDTAEERLGNVSTLLPYELYNPGGLTAVWAVENSRDALFEAFQRRETYSTSGPRITARFFGGWEYPADMCEDEDFVVIGYEKGVPMGGTLPARTDSAIAPTFAVMAMKDPGVEGHPGAGLQQIQIIKGWIDADGNEMEKVIVVAGDPENGASVDTETCERVGEGWETLCAVWTDPDFDPDVPAFYYVRVIENPSCSWSQYDCNTFPEGERPDSCSDSAVAKIIQERAITSPIWYEPGM